MSSRIYYVNSLQRISGTSSHFSYVIGIPAEANYDRCTVLQANIPLSYYIIQKGFSSFLVVEFDDTNVFVDIPVGNYNASSFAKVVGDCMTAASLSGYTYTLTFPNAFVQANTGKFTYTVSGNGTFQPYIVMQPNSPYEQLGFDRVSDNFFVSNTLVSSNVVSFVPETNILIHSDIVNTSEQDHDILQCIFNDNSTPLSNIVYHAYHPQDSSKPMRTNQSNVYWFSITDENDNELDLNGLNCVFTLLLYKRDNASDIIKNYVKWKAAGDQATPSVK